MFKDMTLSEEILKEYKSVDPRKKKFKIQFEIEFFILSQGSWPITQKKMNVKLPKEIQDQNTDFQNFYSHKHPKKSLSWNIELSSSIIKGIFEGGSQNYQFEASGVQTLILLVFNSQKSQTIGQLTEQTGLSEEFLAPALSVLTGKGQDLAVLLKIGDAYQVNDSFKSAQKRLSLNKLPKTDRKSKEEVK